MREHFSWSVFLGSLEASPVVQKERGSNWLWRVEKIEQANLRTKPLQVVAFKATKRIGRAGQFS
jgi:hypothetical protein